MRPPTVRRARVTILSFLLGTLLISIGAKYAPWGIGIVILLVGLALILPEESPKATLNTGGVAHHKVGDPNGPAGIGALLRSESGEVIGEIARGIGVTTNPVADYTALIEGLQMALDKGIKEVHVYIDSPLIDGHLLEQHPVRADRLRPLVEQVRQLLDIFSTWSLTRVPRSMNVESNQLAARGIDEAIGEVPFPEQISVLSPATNG
jgi:ribonuclease HI